MGWSTVLSDQREGERGGEGERGRDSEPSSRGEMVLAVNRCCSAASLMDSGRVSSVEKCP